jgi:hypothetical protein
MTPEEYFTVFVHGNHEDCVANPDCLRRAFNASVSAFHLADHYFAYNTRHAPHLVAAYADLSAFTRFIESATNGAFRDVRSIANAYKHLYEARKSGRPARWSISSGGSLESVEFEGRGRPLQSLETDYGTTSEIQLKVVFRRRDGTHGEFLPTLERVIDFWTVRLYGGDA